MNTPPPEPPEPSAPPPPPPPNPGPPVEGELMPPNAAGGYRGKPPGGKRLGFVEVKRRLELVEAMLSAGATLGQIRHQMNKTFGCGYRVTTDYIARVRARWLVEDEDARPARRAEQRRRLTMDLQKMRTKEGSKPWREIHMHEDLLAKIDGLTRAASVAVQVNNLVNGGVPAGWTALTEEQLAYMAVNGGALPPGLTEDHLISPPPAAPAAPAPAEPAKATP